MPRFEDKADTEAIEEEKQMDGGPPPWGVPGVKAAAPPCDHEWVFLRQEERETFTLVVDVFYCKRCCEYKDVVIRQRRRGF